MRNKKLFTISAQIASVILKSNNLKDKRAVEKWLDDDVDNKPLLDKLSDSEYRADYYNKLDKYNSAEAWAKIEYKLVPYVHHRVNFRTLYKYAAIALLAITVGFSSYYIASDNSIFYENREISLRANGASLILADGEVIDLTSDSSFVANRCNIQIDKNGEIIYYSSDNNITSAKDNRMNTIKTEFGKDYKIALPDGTIAHLNSGSTLRFPVRFSRNKRIIEASGEIYFDVQRDENRPFFVKTKDISIEVLGTKFNLNAYEDNDEIYTTLVSGSLKVINENCSVIISPDQQAICKKGSSEIAVKSVDAETLSLWTEGSFAFRNEKLVDIIKTLQRWYDFDFKFKDKECEDIRMGINLLRDKNFSGIIEALNNADLFTIRQNDRTIIINKKR